MEMMRANVYDKPGHCEITQVPVPEIEPHQVLIKVMSCGILQRSGCGPCPGRIPGKIPTAERP